MEDSRPMCFGAHQGRYCRLYCRWSEECCRETEEYNREIEARKEECGHGVVEEPESVYSCEG